MASGSSAVGARGPRVAGRPGGTLSRLSRVLFVFVIISLSLTLWGIGNLYHAYALVRHNIERVVNIDLPQGSQASRIYARDYDAKTGKGTLLGKLYVENRQQAAYSEIPAQLIACVLSTEDKNFFTHGGVDMLGTLRAVARGVPRGGDLGSIRGTSTITQQLSRNVFLPYIRSQKTLNRKIQEVILAGALEKRFTKQQILEAYLNQIFFGAHAYGVKAAAQKYFGKDLDQLTLAECAMLAGLPQSPSRYNPYKDPDAALARRQGVLRLLASRTETGFFDELRQADPEKFSDLHLTREEVKRAMDEPVKLSSRSEEGLMRAQYFVSYLADQVLYPHWTEEGVRRGGMVVVTTIDPQYQEWAEQTVAAEIDKVRKAKRVSEGALILLEAKTGEVLACVGGYKWGEPAAAGLPDNFNRALQASRQTGSAFKPFTYATAYEQGFEPSMLINDGPSLTVNGKPWPRNSDGTYRGWMSMYYALQWSRNAAAVDLITHCTGVPPVIDTARKMGLVGELPEVPALTLGVADVKPVEMAAAFDTFPSMGNHVDYVLTRRTYNESGILIENNDTQLALEKRTHRVLSENTAWIMVQNMMRVVNAGTGGRARIPGVEICGKTGTCDDFRDAWFIGYSPELVCAVWVGNDDFAKPMNHMFGGDLPAKIFSVLMKKIYAKQTEKVGEGKTATQRVTYTPRYQQVKFVKPPGAKFSGFFGGSAGAVEGGQGEEAEKPAGSEKPPKDASGFYEPYQPPPDNHVYF